VVQILTSIYFILTVFSILYTDKTFKEEFLMTASISLLDYRCHFCQHKYFPVWVPR